MGPHIAQLIEDLDLSKRTQHALHEAGLSNGLLHAVEAGVDNTFGADDAGHTACDPANGVETARDHFLAGSSCVGHVFHRLEAWIDHWDWQKPDAVLYARRQDCDFGEDALVCRAGHDLVGVLFASSVGTYEDDARTQVLDEVPSLARHREQINVVRDSPQYLERRVVLEEEIHLNTNPANILDDMALLHVLRIASEAVEDVVVVQTTDMRNLRESLTDRRLVEVRRVVMEVSMRDVLVHLSSPLRILPVLLAAHLSPLSESRYVLPQPVRVDLAAQPDLRVEATAFLMFEEDVLPHRSNTAELRTVVGTDVDSEVVTRMCDETPALLAKRGNQELIASTAEMRCYRISPL